MKVLGIVCSPRLHGNTEILVRESLTTAQEAGAEVELLTLAGKTVAPCDGCLSCRETKECRIKDDMQAIYPKLLEADGIIFGTPVYFWTVSAQAKALMDRTLVLYGAPGTGGERRLRNKVAGVIVTTGRTGGTSALTVFSGFINLHRMKMAGGAIGLADSEKGKIREDARGMGEAAALGKVIVREIKSYEAKGRKV
jgi:multimeric flavodoxin WrbA